MHVILFCTYLHASLGLRLSNVPNDLFGNPFCKATERCWGAAAIRPAQPIARAAVEAMGDQNHRAAQTLASEAGSAAKSREINPPSLRIKHRRLYCIRGDRRAAQAYTVSACALGRNQHGVYGARSLGHACKIFALAAVLAAVIGMRLRKNTSLVLT